METYLIAALVILLSCIAISAHELGHAFALRACRVPIRTISIFGLGPPLYTFRWRRLFGETPITIRLIPLGAFVEPDEQEAELLSSSDKVLVYGAGPLASFAYGAVMILIMSVGTIWISEIRTLGSSTGLAMLMFGVMAMSTYAANIVACIVALAAITMVPRLLSQYLLPALGVYILWTVAQAILLHPLGAIGGPVSIVNVSNLLFTNQVNASFGIWTAPFIAGLISIWVGVANTMPLGIFDGGRIVQATLQRLNPTAARIFWRVSITCMVLIIGVALTTDVSKLLGF